MAQNKWDRIRGYQVLGLWKKGQNVPGDVLQSARRILQGSYSDADASAVSKYIGSGPSSNNLKRLAGRYYDIANPVADITRDLQLLTDARNTGSGQAAGQARLVQTTAQSLNKILSSRAVKKTVEEALTGLSLSPKNSMLLVRAIGRGLRLGGAAGAVASAVFGVAESMIETTRVGAAAFGIGIDAGRRLHDSRLAWQIEREARAGVKRGSLWGKFKTGIGWVDEWAGAHMEPETAKVIAEQVAAIEQGAKVMSDWGQDPQLAYAEQARRIGKLPAQLTLDERLAAQEVASQARWKAAFDSPEAHRVARLQAGYRLKDAGPFGELFMTKRTEAAADEAERRRVANSVMKNYEVRAKERDKVAQKVRALETAADRQARELKEELAQALYRATRDRRPAWTND